MGAMLEGPICFSYGFRQFLWNHVCQVSSILVDKYFFSNFLFLLHLGSGMCVLTNIMEVDLLVLRGDNSHHGRGAQSMCKDSW